MGTSADLATLKGRFLALINRAANGNADHPSLSPETIWIELEAAYSSPRRAYHTLNHIAAVLRVLDMMPWGTETNAEHAVDQVPVHVGLAAFWHDAVYEAQVSPMV
jgi:predicted metal-dependent HD superfamily phosphohydrolase